MNFELDGVIMRKNRLKKWELALILGALFTTMGGYLEESQENLAEGMIRLHVVANSNSTYDQNLKYVVRDAILAEAEKFYRQGIDPSQAETLFLENIDRLQIAGQSVAQGFAVTAEVLDMWFPTKEYEHFSLPAGDYKALKITIGEGVGENWWCVAYPPLCLGAASESLDSAMESGHFSQEELDLITGNGYILKFKSIEWLSNLKQYFS